MTTAIDHAAFVRQEYRRVQVIDASVKALRSSAVSLTLDTQMDHDSAQALANNILAANKNPGGYELILEGVGVIGDFVGAPPSIIPESSKYQTDGRTMVAFSLSENFENNTSTVQVRG